jgi:hypothetical protein
MLAGALALAAMLPGTAHASADKPALPLKASFEKDTSGKHEAPMVLHLKNESAQELSVSAHIDLSVVVHNRPKTRELPAQKVAAGAVLTIDNLAPEDKVTSDPAGVPCGRRLFVARVRRNFDRAEKTEPAEL